MAGDWIKMRCGLCDEPEVIRLAARTKLAEDTVVGKLHRLWCWADQKSADGNAAGVTKSWLDGYVSHSGFADALVDVGWLEVTTDGINFPNFDRHMGQSGKRRALAADRQAKHREKSNAGRNAPRVTESVTREEKRREEPPPPTPSPIADRDEAAVWGEVKERLAEAGVSAAVAAVNRSPLTAEECLALVAEFEAKRGAWEAGALYKRIIGELDRWPPPKKDWRPPEDREVVAERSRLLALRADLERDHGTAFRKLPAEAMQQLLEIPRTRYPKLGRAHHTTAAIEIFASDPDRWATNGHHAEVEA